MRPGDYWPLVEELEHLRDQDMLSASEFVAAVSYLSRGAEGSNAVAPAAAAEPPDDEDDWGPQWKGRAGPSPAAGGSAASFTAGGAAVEAAVELASA